MPAEKRGDGADAGSEEQPQCLFTGNHASSHSQVKVLREFQVSQTPRVWLFELSPGLQVAV